MKKAVLFIHGFSALPEDNIYFIKTMQKKPDIDIYSFILPGHEQKKVSKVKYIDWLEASERELKAILQKYNRVTIVAHSMGTILALNLASRYSEIEKLVLIAPAYLYGNREQNKKDFQSLIKHEINPNIGTGFEGVLTKIKNVSFTSFLEYRKLVHANKEIIEKVTCDTLILHGTIDPIVPLRSSQYIYDTIDGRKYLTLIDNVRHQVFKSKKKKEITECIYQYIIDSFQYQNKL